MDANSIRSAGSRDRTISEPTSDARSPLGSCQKVNIVTGAWSIHPSIASTFSLEKSETRSQAPATPTDWLRKRYPHLEDAAQVSTSYHEHLEQVDDLDDPNYQDTVTSNDSVGSQLKRSFSVPPEYVYQPSKRKLAKEIFADFLPDGEKLDGSVGTSDDLVLKGGKDPKSKAWRQTMEDLLENPEYMDSLESTSSRTGLLARQAVALARAGRGYATHLLPSWQEVDEVNVEEREANQQTRFIKNLMVLSFSFMFLFTAYLSLRNLQSSLNHEGGLGLYALSCVYASIFVGCTFTTTIVQHLRPKRAMLLAMVSFFVYVLANFYPRYYTLLPACAILGFSLSILWTAQATYLTSIACSYAEITGQTITAVITKFNGIFFFFFQISQILGGVISSTVLMAEPMHHGENKTAEMLESENFSVDHGIADYSHCGVNYCHNKVVDTFGVDISQQILYTLMGVYAVFTVIGFLIILVFLDPLEGIMKKSHATLGQQFSAVFRFFASRRVICLLGLMFYTLFQVSFMFGEFTKSFVTCATGVHMVGYVMLCLSACSAVTCFFSSYIQKCTGRIPPILIAAVIQMGCLITMLLWQPSPERLPVFFILAGAWGVADGLLMTQTISMFGVIFSENKEPAFAGMKMCQSFGVMVIFLTSPYLCTEVKVYVQISTLVIAVVGYLTMEGLDRKDQLVAYETSMKASGTPV